MSNDAETTIRYIDAVRLIMEGATETVFTGYGGKPFQSAARFSIVIARMIEGQLRHEHARRPPVF